MAGGENCRGYPPIAEPRRRRRIRKSRTVPTRCRKSRKSRTATVRVSARQRWQPLFRALSKTSNNDDLSVVEEEVRTCCDNACIVSRRDPYASYVRPYVPSERSTVVRHAQHGRRNLVLVAGRRPVSPSSPGPAVRLHARPHTTRHGTTRRAPVALSCAPDGTRRQGHASRPHPSSRPRPPAMNEEQVGFNLADLRQLCKSYMDYTRTYMDKKTARRVSKQRCALDNFVFQFSSDVVDFSSQYGSDISISYTASNLTGRPSKFPNYGDFPQSYVMVSARRRSLSAEPSVSLK